MTHRKGSMELLRRVFSSWLSGSHLKWRLQSNPVARSNFIWGFGYVVLKYQNITPSASLWAGHAKCMGRSEVWAKYLSGNVKARDHLGDLGINGRIILNRIISGLAVLKYCTTEICWHVLLSFKFMGSELLLSCSNCWKFRFSLVRWFKICIFG